MGDIMTASGSKIYISQSAQTSAIDTIAEFQATTAWTEIGLVESMGMFGDESPQVTGTAIGDGRVRKAKGARDAGMMEVVVFHDPTDLGQAAVEAAQQTSDNYGFKVTIPDGPPGYSDTVKYFRALIMSERMTIGTNDNLVRKTYNLGINSQIYTDASSTP
jgi:hypothetical protein